MVYQYYVFEVKRLNNGDLEHDVTWAFDESPIQARFKGEAAFHTKVAEAALSDTTSHAVTLLSAEGEAVERKVYFHNAEMQEEETETT